MVVGEADRDACCGNVNCSGCQWQRQERNVRVQSGRNRMPVATSTFTVTRTLHVDAEIFQLAKHGVQGQHAGAALQDVVEGGRSTASPSQVATNELPCGLLRLSHASMSNDAPKVLMVSLHLAGAPPLLGGVDDDDGAAWCAAQC